MHSDSPATNCHHVLQHQAQSTPVGAQNKTIRIYYTLLLLQTAASCFAGTAAVTLLLLLPLLLLVDAAAACLRLRASTMVTAISMMPVLKQKQPTTAHAARSQQVSANKGTLSTCSAGPAMSTSMTIAATTSLHADAGDGLQHLCCR